MITKKKKHTENKFKISLKLLYIWLLAVGMNLNIARLAGEHNEKGLITGGNFVTKLLRNFTLAVQDTHNILFVLMLLFLGIVVFSKLWEKEISVKSIVLFIFSFFYSFFLAVGISFRTVGNLSLILGNYNFLLISLWYMLSITIILSKILQLLFRTGEIFFQKYETFDNQKKEINFFKLWFILSLLGLAYVITLYPGTASWDTITQLRYYYGNPTNNLYTTSDYLIPKNASSLNDHHPVFLTLVYGLFADLGVKFGSVNIGIFMLSILQYLFSTYVFSKTLMVFVSLGLKKHILKIISLFYGLFPLFPIFAIYLVKNSIYAVTILWFCTLLLEFIYNKKVINHWKWQVSFLSSIALQLLTMKYGVHVLLLTMIYLCIYFRKYYIKFAILIFIPIVIFQVGYNKILLNKLNVVPGDPVESYTIFFQQTARFVKEYPEDVSPNQKKVLKELFYYDRLADEYQPELSDPVKGRNVYRYNTVTASDLKEYPKVWLEMFLKHPGVYFEATLHNMYGYFDLNKDKGFNSDPLGNGIAVLRIQDNDDLFNSNGTEFKLNSNSENELARTILGKLVIFLANIPIISFLFKGNFYVFLTLLVAIYLGFKKRYDLISVILPLLLQILVCIASPVNDNQRYMYPLFFGSVLCLIVTVLAFTEKKIT